MERGDEDLHVGLALVPRRFEQLGVVLCGEVSPEERHRRQRDRAFDQQVHHERIQRRRLRGRDPCVGGMFRQVQDSCSR